MPPLVCTSPLTYTGQKALRTDLDNLKAALQGVQVEEVFVPSLAPRQLGVNEYYPSAVEWAKKWPFEEIWRARKT